MKIKPGMTAGFFCTLKGKMREKIYLKMLEVAASDPGRAWKLQEIVTELKKHFPEYDFNKDRYISYWFSSHFITTRQPAAVNLLDIPYQDVIKKGREGLDTEEMYLEKESYYSFIETQELKESREATLTAQRHAKTAIYIAIAALIISAVSQISGLFLC